MDAPCSLPSHSHFHLHYPDLCHIAPLDYSSKQLFQKPSSKAVSTDNELLSHIQMLDPPPLRAAKLRPALEVYHHQCITAHFIQLALQRHALSASTLRQVNHLYGQPKPGN